MFVISYLSLTSKHHRLSEHSRNIDKIFTLKKRTMTSFRMELHEKNALARTFYPKYTTYSGDGSGRDGYIVFGNGG